MVTGTTSFYKGYLCKTKIQKCVTASYVTIYWYSSAVCVNPWVCVYPRFKMSYWFSSDWQMGFEGICVY